MSNREGVSFIETLIVIAIIAVLLGLLLPAINTARQRAMETVCKNNLRQINLAVAQYVEIHKSLPVPGNSGSVGGWTIDVLPFLDQKNLWDRAPLRRPISAAPDFLLRQPRILTCPVRATVDPPSSPLMDHTHYILVPVAGRQTYNVFDAPIDKKAPWASGPEMVFGELVRQVGPHHRGFFYAIGFQEGVNFMPNQHENP